MNLTHLPSMSAAPPDDPVPPPLSSKRHHDLDALRAFAMLLGILLHGTLSFVGTPIWPAQDTQQNGELGIIPQAIHGFRMPVFFLMSGFFTAMMWRKRGVWRLLAHRLRRILLPLVLGVIVFVPMLNHMGRLAAWNRERLEARGNSIWTAAKGGDLAQLEQFVREGADLEARDGKEATPLHWAAACGHPEAVVYLVDQGADPNGVDGGGSTPLHWAAFLGRAETVRALIENGARVEARNEEGSTPLGSTEADRGTTRFVVEYLGVDTDLDRVMAARPQVRSILEAAMPRRPLVDRLGALLRGRAPDEKRSPEDAPADSAAHPGKGDPESTFCLARLLAHLYTVEFFGRRSFVFHHLWFLYDLMLLATAFAVVAVLAQWFRLPRLLRGAGDRGHAGEPVAASRRSGIAKPALAVLRAPFKPPLCFVWLIPLTVVTQRYMGADEFGPKTAVFFDGTTIPLQGFDGLPAWWKLGHYAVYFFGGALCFGAPHFGRGLRYAWPLCFALAPPVMLLALQVTHNHTPGFLAPLGEVLASVAQSLKEGFVEHTPWQRKELSATLTVVYGWLMIFGLIGLFRLCFAGGSRLVRYVSDSSYWLYLAHLPLIDVVQIWVSPWQLPIWFKLSVVCGFATLVLLVIYHFAIRYTLAGAMLNGRKTRPARCAAPPPLPASARPAS